MEIGMGWNRRRRRQNKHFSSKQALDKLQSGKNHCRLHADQISHSTHKTRQRTIEVWGVRRFGENTNEGQPTPHNRNSRRRLGIAPYLSN